MRSVLSVGLVVLTLSGCGSAPRGSSPEARARDSEPLVGSIDGSGDGSREWTQPRDERQFGEWPGVRDASASAAESYITTGDQRFDRKDFHGAIDAYSQAIRINPESAYAFCNRGSARRRLEDFSGAVLDLTHAIRLRPEYALAYNNRGYARLKQGKPVEAIEDFNKAIELGDANAPSYDVAMTYRNRARAYRQLGDDDQADADDARASYLQGERRRRVR